MRTVLTRTIFCVGDHIMNFQFVCNGVWQTRGEAVANDSVKKNRNI